MLLSLTFSRLLLIAPSLAPILPKALRPFRPRIFLMQASKAFCCITSHLIPKMDKNDLFMKRRHLFNITCQCLTIQENTTVCQMPFILKSKQLFHVKKGTGFKSYVRNWAIETMVEKTWAVSAKLIQNFICIYWNTKRKVNAIQATAKIDHSITKLVKRLK